MFHLRYRAKARTFKGSALVVRRGRIQIGTYVYQAGYFTRSVNSCLRVYLSLTVKRCIWGVKRSSKIIVTRAMRTATSVCLSLADGKRLPTSCEIDVTSTSRKCIGVG